MNKRIIEVLNLKKSFKNIHAVNDISFHVKEGELFSFLGINGAGKSTTINMLIGSLTADEGSIYIDGANILENISLAKSKIGIVFQNSILDKVLTVKENLKYRAALYQITGNLFQQRLEQLSTLLDFKPLLNRTYGKLSGGQKRKIDIARALLHNPKILILDEPTTGLDPQTRSLVWDVLNKLRKEENLTIFLTTHYMEEASISDYVVIIDNGKIIANDTPTNLKNLYSNDYIKLYFDGLNKEKILNYLDSKKINYKIIKDYFLFQFKTTKHAKEFFIAHQEIFDDFEIIKGDMDDVFLNLTGKILKEVK